MTRLALPLTAVLMLTTACHPGPVLNGHAELPVGGTIAGIVTTSGNVAMPGRTVTAESTSSGRRFTATTGANGGYTIQVPLGTYRIDFALLAGETMMKQPSAVHITRSDVDASRDFVIGPKVAQVQP